MFGRLTKTKPPQPDLCETCGARPKYVEANGTQHPYCGKTCAKKSQNINLAGCPHRNCRSPGKASLAGFCSEKHAKHGVSVGLIEGCDNCKVLPRTIDTLCGPCTLLAHDQSSRKGVLTELSATSKAFKSYKNHFLDQWNWPGRPVPTIAKIFQIHVSREARDKQHACRSAHPSAIEIRTYHSSQCICNFGTTDDSELCSFKSCGICSIAKSSFESLAFGARYSYGRFGDGIYSYQNSAFADRFATSCTSSPYRVSIGCSVIVDGSSTNVENIPIFVKNADAIIPVCIFVYQM